jgi:hypothetical protein
MLDGLLQARVVHRATAALLARLLLCLSSLLLLLGLVRLLVRVVPVRVLLVLGVPRVVDVFLLLLLLLLVVGEAPRDWLVSLPRLLLVGRIFVQEDEKRREEEGQPSWPSW